MAGTQSKTQNPCGLRSKSKSLVFISRFLKLKLRRQFSLFNIKENITPSRHHLKKKNIDAH